MKISRILAAAAISLLTILPASAQHITARAAAVPAVTAKPPYTVQVFAQSVPGVYTAPDSITYSSAGIFIGYGNGIAPDGSDGKASTIVQYTFGGDVIRAIAIKGHNDGLKINPTTQDLWSLQNEDGNATLVIFNTTTWAHQTYVLGTGPHGGGYDDMVFLGGKVYVSASNPQNNPNTQPAIVELTLLGGGHVSLKPVLFGNSGATDIATGNSVTLNLQDPDSMTFNIEDDLVLDSQADGELVVVRNPGSVGQQAFRTLLTVGGVATTVDDTVFPRASEGALLVADRDGETVYVVTKPFFEPGSAYSASDSGGFVGELNFDTGVLTPGVTGMVSPHGMAFIPER